MSSFIYCFLIAMTKHPTASSSNLAQGKDISKSQAEIFLTKRLSEAGISINGDEPHDVQVHNNSFL